MDAMQFLPGLVQRLLQQRRIADGLQQVLRGPARLLHRLGEPRIGFQAVSQMGQGEEPVGREDPERADLELEAAPRPAQRCRGTGCPWRAVRSVCKGRQARRTLPDP